MKITERLGAFRTQYLTNRNLYLAAGALLFGLGVLRLIRAGVWSEPRAFIDLSLGLVFIGLGLRQKR